MTERPINFTGDHRLKPCPFCGEPATWQDLGPYVFSLGCRNQECLGPYVSTETESGAVTLWNRRAEP